MGTKYTLGRFTDENGEDLLYAKEVGEIFGRSASYIRRLVDERKITPRKETGHRGGLLFDMKEVWRALNVEMPGIAAVLASKQRQSGDIGKSPIQPKEVIEEKVTTPTHTFKFPELLNPRSPEAFKNVEEQIIPDIPMNRVSVEKEVEFNSTKNPVKEPEKKDISSPGGYFSSSWQALVTALMCHGYEIDSFSMGQDGKPSFDLKADTRLWRLVGEFEDGTMTGNLRQYDNFLRDVRNRSYMLRSPKSITYPKM